MGESFVQLKCHRLDKLRFSAGRGWANHVDLFSDLTAADFSSLTHLTINDLRNWSGAFRNYVGIHELASGLPRLRHLWANGPVFAIPGPWRGKSAFERLESLKVGFDPLSPVLVAEILSYCDPTKLRAFGFEWEWPGRDKQVRTPPSSGVVQVY